MSDEPALLAAIRANPEEDTPRLVYADFLQERARPGDAERAEFIRVQIELARMEADTVENCVPRWGELSARERDLFQTDESYTLEWFGLPQPWVRIARLQLFSTEPSDYSYAVARRGFIESVTTPAADWLTHGDAIRARHPVMRVRLMTRPIVAGGAGGSYWLPYDPERKGFSVSAAHAICRDRTGEVPADVSSTDLKALVACELRWPGVTFELAGNVLARLPSLAAVTAANLAAAAQQAYAAFAPVATELGNNLAAALLASGAFQASNAEEPNEAE